MRGLGVADETRGQMVAAAVVLQPGHEPADDAARASWSPSCRPTSREQTAPYKYPRRIWFVDELPKTTSGKIQRSLLTPP